MLDAPCGSAIFLGYGRSSIRPSSPRTRCSRHPPRPTLPQLAVQGAWCCGGGESAKSGRQAAARGQNGSNAGGGPSSSRGAAAEASEAAASLEDAAAAAASCASIYAQHELGGARDGDVHREASEIILQMLTRQAATGCRMPCPRAGSTWLASVSSRDAVYEVRGSREREWKTKEALQIQVIALKIDFVTPCSFVAKRPSYAATRHALVRTAHMYMIVDTSQARVEPSTYPARSHYSTYSSASAAAASEFTLRSPPAARPRGVASARPSAFEGQAS